MSLQFKQSTAGNFPFQMVDSTDSITPKTGLSPTVTISKNAGGFGAPGGSVTEVGNGWYNLALNTTDTNTLGPIALYATAAGADPSSPEAGQVFVDIAGGAVASVTGAVGSVTGAVGSVTGAVGSVTGNVGGNVIGTVASVVGNVGGNVVGTVASVVGAVGSVTAVVSANLTQILGTALTETAGQLAAGFKKWFNVVTPTSTMNEITLVDTLTTYTGNTVQTGDAFARIGSPSGVSISSDLAAVGTTATNIFTRIGAPVGASISADIAEIEAETDDIAAIKAKTDNLPSDPADESLVIAATDAIAALIGTPAGVSLAADIAEIEVETDDIAAIKAKTDNLPASPASSTNVSDAQTAIIAAIPYEYKKNTGITGFPFRMFDTSGDPATGLTVVVKIIKDGGAATTSTNSAVEVSLGWYAIDLTAAEMNAKSVALNFAASGAKSYGVGLTTGAA